MSYTFDEKRHIHKFNDIPLNGVTTILGVIAKPALVPWAAKMTTEYIRENVAYTIPGEDGGYWAIKPDTVEQAKKAHTKKRDKAGDWGTVVHKAIEDWIKEDKIPTLPKDQMIAFNHFKDWIKENNITILESEKHVWSEKHWVGGIFDLTIEMDGKKYVADIKTGSGIYNEMFLQMAAYHICLEDMGEGEGILFFIYMIN